MKSIKLFFIASLLLGLSQTAYADHHEAGHGKESHGHSWKDADANKDGVVSKDEFMAKHQMRAEKMFSKLDANKDGNVDAAEVNAMHVKCDKHAK